MDTYGDAVRVGTGNGRGYNGFRIRSRDGNSAENGLNGHDVETRAENGMQISVNSLFRSVDTEHALRLRQFLKRVQLVKDQYIYQQDDQIENIYFPETAVISEFQILEDGRTIEVGIIGSEGAVGIASAFNSCQAANCTQVCVAGTALMIGRDVFEREVTSDARLQLVLHNYINVQIKQLSQRVVCNTFHSVEQRFCSWLLNLQRRSSRDLFKITHEHVARVLGVHRPSVTCIAQALREKKLIDYGRARLAICDPSGLEQLACRCGAEFHGVRIPR